MLDDAFEILEYEHTTGEGNGGGMDSSNISIRTPLIFQYGLQCFVRPVIPLIHASRLN